MSPRALAVMALACLGLATPAAVEDQVLSAECGDKSCVCTLSPLTRADVERVTQIPARPARKT